MDYTEYTNEAVKLLKRLISVPSISRNESDVADIMEETLRGYGFSPMRHKNNVWIVSEPFNEEKPTILINAHIDTVKPVATWNIDPFTPIVRDNKLYGLGSNDCGGGLVSLLQTFRILSSTPKEYNLVYLASAEEEVSGIDGISSVLSSIPSVDVAIVGEPTEMQPAVAEKGLMVVDCEAIGKSGHAARNEGVNSIYIAMGDIMWVAGHSFEKVSNLLGPTKATVTMINAGTQHNVIPDKCTFTIDVRTNELYTNQEVFAILRDNLKSEVRARSFRLNSSSIDLNHPIVRKCIAMGMTPFGSPTLSDQALMPFPSIKLGPGNSSRSHSADEFIGIDEIAHSIETYVKLLSD